MLSSNNENKQILLRPSPIPLTFPTRLLELPVNQILIFISPFHHRSTNKQKPDGYKRLKAHVPFLSAEIHSSRNEHKGPDLVNGITSLMSSGKNVLHISDTLQDVTD